MTGLAFVDTNVLVYARDASEPEKQRTAATWLAHLWHQRAWTIQDRYGQSWWDSLIIAAAQVSQCRYLLTEDLQDLQRFDDVTVINPFRHPPESLD